MDTGAHYPGQDSLFSQVSTYRLEDGVEKMETPSPCMSDRQGREHEAQGDKGHSSSLRTGPNLNLLFHLYRKAPSRALIPLQCQGGSCDTTLDRSTYIDTVVLETCSGTCASGVDREVC